MTAFPDRLLMGGGPLAAATVDTGDTAWLLVSTALVMLMTPALGLFYGGMVRSKNVLGTIMHSFICLGLISVQWVVLGYSFALGPDSAGGFLGSLTWLGLAGVRAGEPNPAYAGTVPHQAYMIFQMMFAVITPALITGAFAERMKFSTFVVFMLVWATLVYDPVAHWVWSCTGSLDAAGACQGVAGWLRSMGALDFAGGTVVHINAGFAALAAAMVLGPRVGFKREPMEPHDVTMTVVGTALLWFGWFGFNAGSALAAGGSLATSAFVATHVATAGAALAWMFLSRWMTGKASVLGTASGAVAGLVAITPASGFVDPIPALIIGVGAGVFCYIAVRIRSKSSLDDSLDVFGVHGIGGIWGALATGLFASLAVNSAGADGLFIKGDPKQFFIQVIAVVVTAAYSFVATFIILKVLDAIMGLRVDENAERQGLDLSQHGEPAYVSTEA